MRIRIMLNRTLEKETLFRSITLGFPICLSITTVSFILAIVFYPGGNVKDNTEDYFNFLWNNWCDLGREFARNGELNIISQSFFRGGAIVFLISLLAFFSILWLFFTDKPALKTISLIATILMALSTAAYPVVIFSEMGNLHMTFLITAPLLEYFAIILYTVVFFIDKRFPKLTRFTFLAMSSLAIIYSGFAISANIVRGDFILLVHRLGHTIFMFVMLIGYTILGIGTHIFVKNYGLKPS